MPAIRAYFDESGIHANAEICGIAGFFGNEGSWKNLESKWETVLREFEVCEFHAERFWSRDESGRRVKPYAGWSDPKADKFLERLLQAIKRCRIYPIGAAVVGKEWEALSRGERIYLTGGEVRNGKFRTAGSPSKKYFLPFLQVVQRVARYCKNDERACFFFGLDRTFSGYALNYYRDIIGRKWDWTAHLGDIAFPRSGCTKPLQAADLLAYEVYQYAIRRLSDWGYSLDSCPRLASALTRVKCADDDFKLYDKPSLDAALGPLRKQYPQLCS
jgi:hypothetical protein